MSEPETITFREVGSNPLEDQANASVRVDMSKNRLLPRLGKIFWPGREGDKPVASPPAPPIDPVVELEQKRELLAHLQSQFAIVKARTEGKIPGQTTALQAIDGVRRDYGNRLANLEDVAGQQWADVGLLLSVLEYRGEGLIPCAKLRISQLEKQTTPPASPTEEHQRRIAKALKSFKAAGRDYQALREFEADPANHVVGSVRYQFTAHRPAFGPNYSGFEERELRRFAEFTAMLPDSK